MLRRNEENFFDRREEGEKSCRPVTIKVIRSDMISLREIVEGGGRALSALRGKFCDDLTWQIRAKM